MTTQERWAIEDLRLPPSDETMILAVYERLKEIVLSNDPTLESLRDKLDTCEQDYKALEANYDDLAADLKEVHRESYSLKDEIASLQEKLDALS